MCENDLAREAVDSALLIHKELGPGLLESVYERCLAHELSGRGISVKAQVPFSVEFRGVPVGPGFRMDLILEEKVIIEVKSVEMILAVHKKQLLTYLKLTGHKLGLLFNFNEVLLKDGITRIVHNL